MSLWEYITDFITWIVIPSPDYFSNRVMALNNAVYAKLGGVSRLFQQINYFWGTLDSVKSSEISFTIPNNYFYVGYQGITMDFLQSARPYLSVMNSVLTASVYIFTAIICYHKLRSLFSEGGTAT